MKVIIDRFEGDFALCEKDDRTMIDIPISSIQGDAKEGDILVVDGEKIIVDHKATEIRKKEIAELAKGMWK